jgi:hypothetical protein
MDDDEREQNEGYFMTSPVSPHISRRIHKERHIIPSSKNFSLLIKDLGGKEIADTLPYPYRIIVPTTAIKPANKLPLSIRSPSGLVAPFLGPEPPWLKAVGFADLTGPPLPVPAGW